MHNLRLPWEEVEYGYRVAGSCNFDSRCLIPGLNRERADIVTAGFAVVRSILDYLQAEE